MQCQRHHHFQEAESDAAPSSTRVNFVRVAAAWQVAHEHLPPCATASSCRRLVGPEMQHEGGTWAVGVGVAQDGGGGAVQVGVHVQVAGAQVALDQQLVLLRVAPAHHQVAARQHHCCLSVRNSMVNDMSSLSHSCIPVRTNNCMVTRTQ